ncbi:hypothetical protein A8B75_18595 [Sphingomonadales bacterium EhC05]|nr:hypothetical protein A8B75_18595 [Sphingomonadales bacterium EhC05]
MANGAIVPIKRLAKAILALAIVQIASAMMSLLENHSRTRDRNGFALIQTDDQQKVIALCIHLVSKVVLTHIPNGCAAAITDDVM